MVVAAVLGFVALVANHLQGGGGDGLLGGWFPAELAWRLGWVALAALYLVLFCRFVWRDDEGGA